GLRDAFAADGIDPRCLAHEDERTIGQREVGLEAALGEALVLVVLDLEAHRGQALTEARVNIHRRIVDHQMIDAAAYELAPIDDGGKIPAVPGEFAIRGVEVERSS